MKILETATLGEGWLRACRAILEEGTPGRDGDEPIRELLHLTVRIARPSPEDRWIEQLADARVLAWMRDNFTRQGQVPELSNSLSYATRLRDFRGQDQVAWVIQKLRSKPETKSATITTLLGDDVGYIPCVSLLDFKLRREGLLLSCCCRSLDVGVKMPANLVELARLQQEVAGAIGAPVGELVLWIVSAHVYGRDLARVGEILAESGQA